MNEENKSVVEIERTLNDVSVAMRRLADGTYRACVSCGSTIEPELLEADPLRTSCRQHPQIGSEDSE